MSTYNTWIYVRPRQGGRKIESAPGPSHALVCICVLPEWVRVAAARVTFVFFCTITVRLALFEDVDSVLAACCWCFFVAGYGRAGRV